MDQPRPLDPSARITLAPAATRRLGHDLYVNVGGANTSVKCLTGSGPELWWSFDKGLTIAEAAALEAARTRTPVVEVEAHVLRFAEVLVDAQLGVATW